METVQQNGRFTLFSIKFLSIYSILYAKLSGYQIVKIPNCQVTILLVTKFSAYQIVKLPNCWLPNC